MKQNTFLVTLLAIMFSILMFNGCEQSQPDIWDGTVADKFSAGVGTAKQPYEISSGAELAYLARQVNAGNEYADKFFVLTNDIDLNDLEWLPIGNGTYSFSGNLDGRMHSVINMSITNITYFERHENSDTYTYGLAGLFGSCKDANISNLSILDAAIRISDIPEFDYLYVGILSGSMFVGNGCVVSDIDITDAQIAFEGTANEFGSLHTGGIAGDVQIDPDSELIFEQLNVSAIADFMYNSIHTINVGGIAGHVTNHSAFWCSGFTNELSVLIQPEHTNSNVGAFGALLLTTDPEKVTISSIGKGNSIVKSNFIAPDVNVYAICGSVEYSSEQAEGLGYSLYSLRGCVMPVDDTAAFSEPMAVLYVIPEGVLYQEDDCVGCQPAE